MTYGFKSISSTNFAQIDDSFENFVLVQEGVASGNFYNVPLVDSIQNVIVMVRLAYGNTFFTKSTTNPSYEYRVYARQQLNQQNGGHGLIVNNSAGVRIFDSGVKKLNVRAVHYLTLSDGFSQVTYPSVGFRPWVGIGCLETTGWIGQPFVQVFLLALFLQQNSNDTVTFFQQPIASAPLSFTGFWGGGTKSVIIGD